MLLPLALVLAAAPAGPSPATLTGVTFYEPAFVASLEPRHLASRAWPTLTFDAPGALRVFLPNEETAFTFTAEAGRDGAWTLELRAATGERRTATWRWIDRDRAETDLWDWVTDGKPGIASRARPTPEERRDAFGEKLATARLRRGDWRSPDGGLVFALSPGGRVRWGARRGTFFECSGDCAADAGTFVCLGLEEPRRRYLFSEQPDGGIVGAAAAVAGQCAAGCTSDLGFELVPGGEAIRTQ